MSPMIRSLLIGLVAGQRGMTPLAVVAGAARDGRLPRAVAWLGHPLVAGGAVALAGAEMAGDKMRSAPDRTIPPGLLARALTAGFAGAHFAPGRRKTAALVAAAGAVAASHLGLALRRRAMRRWGQTATGFVEDALVAAGGLAIATARPR